MKLARSLARKAMASATSSGRATRPSDQVAMSDCSPAAMDVGPAPT
jgi:hypothetical protein